MPRKLDWDSLLDPKYPDLKTMIEDLYVSQNLGMQLVADKLGCNKTVILKMLKEFQIPLKAKGRPSPNNRRVEKPQRPNKPKDYQEEILLKREAHRLGMRPDGFIPETRKSEKRNCPRYDDCWTYTSLIHGWLVPCYKCDGNPEFLESMERTLPVFEEQFFSLPEIDYRKPGVKKPVRKENQFGYKFLEGMLYEKENKDEYCVAD
jgi:hypothetical protein